MLVWLWGRECFDRDSIIEKNCGGQKEHAIICVIASVFKLTLLIPQFEPIANNCPSIASSESFYFSFICFTPQIMIWYNFLLVQQTWRVCNQGKLQVSRSCGNTRVKAPVYLSGCLKKWRRSALITHMFKRKGERRKNTAATLSKVSQALSKEVCHDGWSGQEIIICSALEEGKPEGERHQRRRSWRHSSFYVETQCIITGVEMSFQYKQQGVDSSYVSEHSRGENEPESGGYWGAMGGFWYSCYGDLSFILKESDLYISTGEKNRCCPHF